MPGRPLSAVLAGAGAIAAVHLETLARMRGVRVTGLADPALNRARELARRYDVPRVEDRLDRFLADDPPDVVHVLTPPPTHADLAVAALRSNAHVYVEKPMAVTEAECRRMEEASVEAGRLLCVGHSMVHDPLFTDALGRIESGKIGYLLQACFSFASDPRRHRGLEEEGHWSRLLPGGPMEDVAVHPASVLVRLLGEPLRILHLPPAGLHASPTSDRTRDEPRVTDAARGLVAAMEGRRGLGVILLSLGARPPDTVLEVRGTAGSLRLNYSNRTLVVERERSVPRKLERGLRNLEVAGRLVGQTVASTARFLGRRLDATGGVRTLVEAFYEAMAAGGGSPVPPEQGRQAVRLLRALWPAPSQARDREAVASGLEVRAP